MKVVSQGRTDLPKGLTYPLSLNTISEVVADTEVDADLRVCFMQNKKVKQSPKARRKYRDSSSDILVASYEYQPVSLMTPNRMIGDGHYSYAAPVWDLRVFAVDVSQLKEIKAFCMRRVCPGFEIGFRWQSATVRNLGMTHYMLAVKRGAFSLSKAPALILYLKDSAI